MGKSIGIDLGTTNSVVAFKDATVRVIATGPNNEDLCRSCVAIDRSGSFTVGNAPYKNWRRYAPNIVVHVQSLLGATINDATILRMKNDKRCTGVLARDIRRSNMLRLIINLIYEGAISEDDLKDFSEDLQDTVKTRLEIDRRYFAD